MGKPPYFKDQRENRTSNTLRTEIREQSLGTADGNIRILKSLQTCYLKDSMKVLDEHSQAESGRNTFPSTRLKGSTADASRPASK